MKNGKRWLSLLLSVIMLVGLVPWESMVVRAAEAGAVTLEEPTAGEMLVWQEDKTGKLQDGENYILVTKDGTKALYNGGTDNTCIVSIDDKGVLNFVNPNEEAGASWKAGATGKQEYPYALNNDNKSVLGGQGVFGESKEYGLKLTYNAGNETSLLQSEQYDTAKGSFCLTGNNEFQATYTWDAQNAIGVRLFKKQSSRFSKQVIVKREGQADSEVSVEFDILDEATWYFTPDKFGMTDATLVKIEKVIPPASDWEKAQTILVKEGNDAKAYKLSEELFDDSILNFVCTFKDNNPIITAEFYMIQDPALCKYDDPAPAFLGDQNPAGAELLGSVQKKFFMEEDGTQNLLKNPVALFEEETTVQDKLQGKNYELYEVRSAKRAIMTANGTETSQYVYASKNEQAINRKDGEWSCPIDNENKPRLLNEQASLGIGDLNSNTIKYIFLEKKVFTIDYIVVMNDENRTEHKVAALTGDVGGKQIIVPDFSTYEFPIDADGKTVDEKIAAYGSAHRQQLVPKNMKLFDADGNQLGAAEMDVSGTCTIVGDSSSYKLEVRYIQPDKPGKAVIQLPVTLYDYDADGMFFEFCSNDYKDMTGASYGFSMNPDPGALSVGLIEEQLNRDTGSPRIVYKKEAVAKIADLIFNGKIWNGKNGQFSGDVNSEREADFTANNVKIRTLVEQAKQGGPGSYKNVESAQAVDSSGGIVITKDEVKNCYTAAAYMMSHFFDAADDYGKKVSGIHALELREYTDPETGQTSYVYDAAWKSEVVGGVIRNKEENGSFTGAEARREPANNNYSLLSSYYMPIDWLADAGDSDLHKNTYDQYENANFLFTTVGEGTFVYESAKNLRFKFTGDDDVYLFINDKLVLDMGGAHSALISTLDVNQANNEKNLGLKDGETYPFTFFHMERHGTGSNFRMETNINISAPELTTHKYAYQKETNADGTVTEKEIPNGGSVETKKEYYYAFSLQNEGNMNMYNLSFWDMDLGVQLYPTGITNDVPTTLGKTKGTWGEVVLDIGNVQADGSVTHEPIDKYSFSTGPEEGHSGCTPVIPDTEKGKMNPMPEAEDDYYGKSENITLAQLYRNLPQNDDLLPDQMDEAYQKLLRDILQNGIKVHQIITIKGFKYDLDANETFHNTVQTYGMTYNHQGKMGSDTHKVICRGDKTIVKVIDYGKPVTYGFHEIFDPKLQFESIQLNVGNPPQSSEMDSAEGPRYKAATGNTYKTGYSWKDDKLVKEQLADEVLCTTTVARGDGKGYFWNPDTTSAIDGTKFTFEPLRIMDERARFGFEIRRILEKEEGQTEAEIETYNKYLEIYPANIVYYEDNFESEERADGSEGEFGIIYTNSDNGTNTSMGTDNVYEQDADAGTTKNPETIHNGNQQYGYDKNYGETSGSGDSNGTAVKMENKGSSAKASFTFKGTGFDIVGRTDRESTVITYIVRKETEIVTYGAVDTLYQNGTLYQIPVIHVENLDYGEYTVTLTVSAVKNDTGNIERGTFYLDGIRIYNPMGNQDTPYLAQEEDAEVEKLNSLLLGNGQITEEGVIVDGSLVTTGIKVEGARAALLNVNEYPIWSFLPITYTEDVDHPAVGSDNTMAAETDSLCSVLRHGPNNEVYLGREGAFALILDNNPYEEGANGTLQIEAKLVQTGEGTNPNPSATISYWTGLKEEQQEFATISEIKTTTAMYYKIPEEALLPMENADGTLTGTYLVVIRGGDNAGDAAKPTHMISFSNVKYKGCTIAENPADEKYKEDAMMKEWFTPLGQNRYLVNIEVPTELKIKRNTDFNVVIPKGSYDEDDWNTFVNAVRANSSNGKFKITSRLSAEGAPKDVSYKGYADNDSRVVLTIRSPKARGVYTITLEYTYDYMDSDGTTQTETEAFSFSINVTNPGNKA